MPGKRNVTLKTIAEHLGVSITTVSLVINRGKGYERISQDTVDRVMKACEELGYRPNFFAQRLKRERTGQIAVMASSLYNQFTPPFLDGIRSVLIESGYNLMIFNSETNYVESPFESVPEPVAEIITGGVDGVISHIGHKQIDAIVQGQVPVIHVDEDDSIRPCVGSDMKKAAYQITELFLKRGCTRIAYIGVGGRNDFQYTFGGREKGYRQAMRKHKVPVQDDLIKNVVPTIEGGHEAFDWLISLPKLPQAVVICTDLIAHIVHSRLVQSGVRIPQDIGTASIDDTYPSALMIPPMTSVYVPAYDTGVHAANLMLDALQGVDVSNARVILKTELNERESSRVPERRSAGRRQ